MDTEPHAPGDIQATEVEEPAKGLLKSANRYPLPSHVWLTPIFNVASTSSSQGDDQPDVPVAEPDSEGHEGHSDSEHPDPRRRSTDGKLRGKSTSSTVKGGGSTGTSRPSGPKNDSDDASVSPQEDVDVKEGEVNKTTEEPAPPKKKKGKLRGRSNPNDAKGGSGGAGSLPKGPKH